MCSIEFIFSAAFFTLSVFVIMKAIITDYMPYHKATFKTLCEEWIQEHEVLKDHGKDVITDPERFILSKGGQIIFATVDDCIVGTAALCLKANGQYEMAKLSVTKAAQGQGIGYLLCQEIIKRAKESGLQYLYLSTHPVLEAAITLYEKLGFIRINTSSHTAACEIDMRLEL
jgi:ribosomal protein S18 acetylase RimI-like enzyme